jgi:hypothetical protein
MYKLGEEYYSSDELGRKKTALDPPLIYVD